MAVGQKTDFCGVIYYLLLLCGDISTNPGPIKHPCTVCDRSVKINQRGLLCDLCGNWSHACCVGVDTRHYSDLSVAGEFNWQCPSCLLSALPYYGTVTYASDDEDSSMDSDSDVSEHDLPLVSDAVGVLLSDVRLIHHDVQGLLSKMPEIMQ